MSSKKKQYIGELALVVIFVLSALFGYALGYFAERKAKTPAQAYTCAPNPEKPHPFWAERLGGVK